nr:sterile alpha motif domain-containing protein 1-like [Kogia breviceps]
MEEIFRIRRGRRLLRAPGRRRGLAPVRAEKLVELRTSSQTSTRAAPTPARVLIGSPEKRRPIPRALSSFGVETPQTARALASQDGPGGPGGQRPPLAVPRPFTPSLRAGRLYVPPSPSSSRPLPVASTGSQAAGAAQAVTQGGGGRSRRRRGEQMALKKTQEPAARAHIQLASARRAPPPPSPWPRRLLATRAGGGSRTGCLATETVLLSPATSKPPAPSLGSSGSRLRPLLRLQPSLFYPLRWKGTRNSFCSREGPRSASLAPRSRRPPCVNNSSFLLTTSTASSAGFASPNSVGIRGFRRCSSLLPLHPSTRLAIL